MIIIAGLGNPGQKYESTWHNLGRLAVLNWQKKVGFADFRLERKFNSLVSKGSFEKKEILLALPESFMNQSGKAVKSLISSYRNKIATADLPRQLIVVHDDADLQKGEIRVSKNRGTAGHKGLDSIVGSLKTKNFTRIRIGVRPKNYVPGSKSLERFVLKKFTKDEEKLVAEVLKKISGAIETILEVGVIKAMNRYNR